MEQATIPGVIPGFVDVRDVARLVVFGVEHPEKANGERFITSSAYAPAQAIVDILRKAYPERSDIIQKGTPGSGYFPGYAFPAATVYDGSKAVRVTEQDYIPFEKTVLDAAEAYKHIV